MVNIVVNGNVIDAWLRFQYVALCQKSLVKARDREPSACGYICKCEVINCGKCRFGIQCFSHCYGTHTFESRITIVKMDKKTNI